MRDCSWIVAIWLALSRRQLQALHIYERMGGPGCVPVSAALIEAGLARELGGDAISAEPLFRRALGIRRAQMPPGAPLTIAAQVRLGEALLAEGKVDQAVRLLREAVEFVAPPGVSAAAVAAGGS
jgi:Tetratricopeptide repeat